ncbi:MAG: hypothetical protein ABIF77_07490 [bacterium]
MSVHLPIRSCCWLAVVWLLVAVSAQAGGIVEVIHIYRQAGQVRLELRAREILDRRTASTVDSGLPGTCVYHLQLLDEAEQVVVEFFLELTLQLDLWENRYLLDCPSGRHVFPSLAAADSAWSHLIGIDLCPEPRLAPDLGYRLQVQIAVQPLAPEVRKRLSRYVSSNSSRNREELALDLGAVFGRILGGDGPDNDNVRFVSPWFRIGDLEERP